jgi:hypothetical protein
MKFLIEMIQQEAHFDRMGIVRGIDEVSISPTRDNKFFVHELQQQLFFCA